MISDMEGQLERRFSRSVLGKHIRASDFAYKIFSSLVLSVIWTWIFNNAKDSILMALVLHGAGNAISMLINGWGAMFSTASVSTLADILLGVCALLIIIVTRGRLAYTPGAASSRNASDERCAAGMNLRTAAAVAEAAAAAH